MIESARGSVGLFMSFVWFVALELERLMAPVTAAAVEEVLQRSLAWCSWRMVIGIDGSALWLRASGRTSQCLSGAGHAGRRRGVDLLLRSFSKQWLMNSLKSCYRLGP